MKIMKNENNNYEFKKLKDILKINLGQSPSSESYVSSDFGLPFYQGVAEFGDKYPTPKIYTNATKKNANKNEILMTVRAPVGRINIAKEKCSIGRGLCSLSSENNLYIYYSLNEYKNKWKLFVQGSIFEAVNKKDIENFKIPYAPKEEQKKIVKLLSEKDQHIENIKTLISKLEKRNEYYAEKLLSGELRVRENEKGEIEFYENTEWKEVKLNGKLKKIPIDSNIIKLKEMYSDINEKTMINTVPYLEIGDIDINKKNYNIKNKSKGSVDNAKLVPKGTLLISTVRPTRLAYTITNEEIVVSSAFARFYIDKDLFLLYYLKSSDFLNYIEINQEGATYPTIKTDKLKEFEVLIINNKEKVINFLEKINKEKKILENLLEKETKEFEWLSEKLLSGEYIIED